MTFDLSAIKAAAKNMVAANPRRDVYAWEEAKQNMTDALAPPPSLPCARRSSG